MTRALLAALAALLLAPTAIAIAEDPPPTLSISGDIVAEGDTGTAEAEVVLTLSRTATQPVSVAVSTVAGSATTEVDYIGAAETVTIPAGQTTLALGVEVRGDTVFEDDETFYVDMANATNATISYPRATVVIQDDEPLPVASISDASMSEGSGGSFTVTLDRASSFTTVIEYVTSDETAKAPADYTSKSDEIAFYPGETTRTVSVRSTEDTEEELDETFAVTLRNPDGAALGRARGVATIRDDEPLPSVSVTQPTVTEGDSGSQPATFTVTLSRPSVRTVDVWYETADGTAKTWQRDYDPANGQLTFAPGETSHTVDVGVLGDRAAETTETFTLRYSTKSPSLTSRSSRATAIIVDNDVAAASVLGATIDDVSVTETNRRAATAIFRISLSRSDHPPVTVRYTTADATAKAIRDYKATSGVLTFQPGEFRKTVSVPVVPDRRAERNERFSVSLSQPVGVTLGRATATGTIVDDDRPACVVPRLLGLTLEGARKRLWRAWCEPGTVTYRSSAKVGRGRVVSSTPRPGAKRAGGAPIRLVLSTGPAQARP